MGQFSPSVSFLDSQRRSRGHLTCSSVWKRKRDKGKRLPLPVRKALGGKGFFSVSINFMVSVSFSVLKQRGWGGAGECVVTKKELRKLTIMHPLDSVVRHDRLHSQNTF